MKAKASICILSSFIILSLCGAQTATPTPDDPRMPYPIDAPWPADLAWDAGGLGYYYEQATHEKANLYALDFNATDQSDGGVLVLSVADGVVRQASCEGTGGYGCTVVIGHAGDGTYCYQSRYAHLREKSLLVSKNDWVAQGEPLGRVGSTGRSTKDHLHFAVYRRPLTECSRSAPARNDKDMAVKPEPMEATRPITEGAKITSTNYPVGYPRLTEKQIRVPGTPLPPRHQAILDTYKRFGGQFWVFGQVQGPVQTLADRGVYYQEFGPHTFADGVAWYGQPSAIVEHDGEAYLMIGPIWEAYRDAADAATRYGPPISDGYEWYRRDSQGDLEIGFRNDFRDASLIWDGRDGHGVEIVDAQNSEWQASMWDQPNRFDGPAYVRRDRYLDFYWPDASLSGPFTVYHGFSARWETSAGGFISAYTLQLEMQGHMRIVVDDKEVLSQDSPNSVWSGSSRQFGLGPERIEVFYWQDGTRPGRIKVGVKSMFVPPAFATEGEMAASSVAPGQVEYADFPPPVWEEIPEPEVRDSAVISTTDPLALQPNEPSELVFEIQNTGNVSWLPGEGYALVNTNEESLGASPVQTLAREIPPGSIAQWVVPITAPGQISLNWTEWQMAYGGEPFGAKASCLVAVVPEGEIDIDLGALLARWLDELKKEIGDRFDQFLQDLADRFKEWLQRESERLVSELLESLSQQCCGAAAIAPGALLLVAWTSGRRRRKRIGDRDRD